MSTMSILLWILAGLAFAFFGYPQLRRHFLIWKALFKLRRIARHVKDKDAREELTKALDEFQASDWSDD